MAVSPWLPIHPNSGLPTYSPIKGSQVAWGCYDLMRVNMENFSIKRCPCWYVVVTKKQCAWQISEICQGVSKNRPCWACGKLRLKKKLEKNLLWGPNVHKRRKNVSRWKIDIYNAIHWNMKPLVAVKSTCCWNIVNAKGVALSSSGSESPHRGASNPVFPTKQGDNSVWLYILDLPANPGFQSPPD